MSEDYQHQIMNEYVQYGGTYRSAMNIMKSIDRTYNATKQIKNGPKETILKAILLEKKTVINSLVHLTNNQKNILCRYLHYVHRKHLCNLRKER